jgi:hypothetical protein
MVRLALQGVSVAQLLEQMQFLLLYIIIDGTFGIARGFGGTVVRTNVVFLLYMMVRLALQGVSVAQLLE